MFVWLCCVLHVDVMDWQPENEVVDNELNCDVYSDQHLLELIAERDEYAWEFLRVLALCHTVVSVEAPDGTFWSVHYVVDIELQFR